jgi:hypothetical protein
MKPKFRQHGLYWFCDYHYRGTPMWFLFTQRQLNRMIENYRKGSCSITDKGLLRYSDIWIDKSWLI